MLKTSLGVALVFLVGAATLPAQTGSACRTVKDVTSGRVTLQEDEFILHSNETVVATFNFDEKRRADQTTALNGLVCDNLRKPLGNLPLVLIRYSIPSSIPEGVDLQRGATVDLFEHDIYKTESRRRVKTREDGTLLITGLDAAERYALIPEWDYFKSSKPPFIIFDVEFIDSYSFTVEALSRPKSD
jgi:hypothetical protein